MLLRHTRTTVDSHRRVSVLAEFYREELQRCHQQLLLQRECYSGATVACVELALGRVMDRIEILCRQGQAEQVVGGILDHFSHVASRQAWMDGRRCH